MVKSAREALTEAVLTHFLTGGRLDESLRATAAAIGAGHSLLLYHYGSREGMLTEVHLACERREREHLAALRVGSGDPFELMREMWRHLADPAMWPIYRLGFSLKAARAGHAVDAADREAWLSSLAPLAEAVGVPRREARAESLLWLATTRGLLWELVTGADPAAVDEAAERLFPRPPGPAT